MKKLVATLAAILVTAVSYGQGQVNFENFTIPDAMIKNPNGTGVGANGKVQLFLGSTALGTPQAFEASSPGFFFAGVVTVPGAAVGSSQTFDVKAWVDAASYDAATVRGVTQTTPTSLGGDNIPPPNVIFSSFTLVPEPSTIALGILGAAALLFRRRK
jgi:hypothetical protein